MSMTARALEIRASEERPIQVAVVGAGFMARGLTRHIETSVRGMRVAAISSRRPERILDTFSFAGAENPTEARSARHLDRLVRQGTPTYTSDFATLVGADQIDVIVDATGAVEYGSQLALAAISHGRHVVSLNAEVDATVGSILQQLATRAGVVRSAADGDQPAVQARLAEFAVARGLTPRVLGNVKGLHDVHRNPTTQTAFAARWGQSTTMVTSFADGTKINFEQALVANALGLTVGDSGMAGRSFDGHVDELAKMYASADWAGSEGIVDYVVGAKPAPGVYCLAEAADDAQRHYLELFKLGPGPLYSLYAPYHLCHLEIPTTIVGVVDFREGVLPQDRTPTVEVVALAKIPLRAGTTIDGLGGYRTYGRALPLTVAVEDNLLPMGLAEGCVLRRDIQAGVRLTIDDVSRPAGRVIDRLHAEQRLMATQQ
jgi:predicted homoserine dehydrogenase-like protein